MALSMIRTRYNAKISQPSNNEPACAANKFEAKLPQTIENRVLLMRFSNDVGIFLKAEQP
jgi:hypothetical protein